jgi:general secretion pathway protein I
MTKNNFHQPNSQRGFTLLEVIIAMTIVGMVLGTTFSLLAGSKRLAFKAANDIGEVLFLRSAINVAQVLEKPEYPKLPPRFADNMELKPEDVLEKPEVQTRPIMIALEPYTLHSKQKGLEITTVRWKKLDAPH